MKAGHAMLLALSRPHRPQGWLDACWCDPIRYQLLDIRELGQIGDINRGPLSLVHAACLVTTPLVDEGSKVSPTTNTAYRKTVRNNK